MTADRVSTFGYFYLGGGWRQGADLGILARILARRTSVLRHVPECSLRTTLLQSISG